MMSKSDIMQKLEFCDDLQFPSGDFVPIRPEPDVSGIADPDLSGIRSKRPDLSRPDFNFFLFWTFETAMLAREVKFLASNGPDIEKWLRYRNQTQV